MKSENTFYTLHKGKLLKFEKPTGTIISMEEKTIITHHLV